MPDTPITFDDVELVTDAGLTRHYRIGKRVVVIGRAVPLDGTTVYAVGQVGRLVLPRWFAETVGLESRKSGD